MNLSLSAKDRILTRLADRMHNLDGIDILGTDSDTPAFFEMVGHAGGSSFDPYTPIVKVTDADGNEVMRFSLVVE